MRIGCIGEVMLELVPGEGDAATLGVAGDTFNTAVYLARALSGGAVDYLTVLGKDGFSDHIVSRVEGHRVGSGRILRHPTKVPGLYAIKTDTAGERHFTYWRSASAARQLFDLGYVPDFEGLTHLFFSGISIAILTPQGRDTLFEKIIDFRARGGQVAFDSNYRPQLWEDVATAQAVTEQAWGVCDIALPSLDDEMALFGDPDEDAVMGRFAGYGLSRGALKRAALGPLSIDGGAGEAFAPAAVVDSTAAGDSFNAGYLACLLQGGDQTAALRAGHDLASLVVGHRGAIIREDVQK
ncbi:MAG: sugar kinase [Pseudomonadota bacterium]